MNSSMIWRLTVCSRAAAASSPCAGTPSAKATLIAAQQSLNVMNLTPQCLPHNGARCHYSDDSCEKKRAL
ncbi:MAG: hypothetical protein RR983_13000 [Massilia sp.]|uniref:hypothetical protein n=1 Tax=Massilia sp. TaxID=1882437 RepID=UPI002FC74F30